MLNCSNLPEIMFFGSSKRVGKLKGRVFLSPHIGIASLFIIDVDDLFNTFPAGYETSCNISYRQWYFPQRLVIKAAGSRQRKPQHRGL